jgi:hypothetical protein
MIMALLMADRAKYSYTTREEAPEETRHLYIYGGKVAPSILNLNLVTYLIQERTGINYESKAYSWGVSSPLVPGVYRTLFDGGFLARRFNSGKTPQARKLRITKKGEKLLASLDDRTVRVIKRKLFAALHSIGWSPNPRQLAILPFIMEARKKFPNILGRELFLIAALNGWYFSRREFASLLAKIPLRKTGRSYWELRRKQQS